MNLRQRLEQLDRGGALNSAARARVPIPGSLEELLGGYEVPGPRGSFLLCRRVFPRDHRYGCACLAGATALTPRWLPRLGRGLDRLDPRRLVFLDTETTGLSGGTGTYAFLVGLAWLEPDGLCLEQLLMREHAEEAALLEYLARRLEGCGGVVSYNGKTFDIPLLQTRFVMKRLRLDLEGLPHLDLLHPSRRLWSTGLPDCRLETMERHVLLAPRTADLPGREIPETYFRYLRTGDGHGLARVVEHNQRDLLALMGLTALLAQALEVPLEGRPPQHDLGLGRCLAAWGEVEAGTRLLTRALQGPLPGPFRGSALLSLARLRRRMGDRVGAVALWREVLQEDPSHPEAGEELAKHLEHQSRDPRGALDLVERILARRDLTRARRQALECRQARLSRQLLDPATTRNPRRCP